MFLGSAGESVEFVDVKSINSPEEDPLDIILDTKESDQEGIAAAESIDHKDTRRAAESTDLLDALGARPRDLEQSGDDLHEEIVVRWTAHLQRGLDSKIRKELQEKYPLPRNCPQLQPPQLNSEVLPCLPEPAKKHEAFMLAMQHQLAYGLAAVGSVMTQMINTGSDTQHLTCLADASQIFSNIHNAMSAHRRYKILPHLNEECKKVVQASTVDKFLFGENFGDSVKANQAIKKASAGIKKRKWQPPAPVASTSSPRPTVVRPQPATSLNFRQPSTAVKMKERALQERRRRGTGRQPASFRSRRD